MVRFSGWKPVLCRSRLKKVRIIRPAPASNRIDIATSATTRPLRRRAFPLPGVLERAPSLSASTRLWRLEEIAGAAPAIRLAAMVTDHDETKNAQIRREGHPRRKKIGRRKAHHTGHCRGGERRAANRAGQPEDQALRDELPDDAHPGGAHRAAHRDLPRACRCFDQQQIRDIAQAISSTNPTAASSVNNSGWSDAVVRRRNGSTLTDCSNVSLGFSRLICSITARRSASACWIETPGARRATPRRK